MHLQDSFVYIFLFFA